MGWASEHIARLQRGEIVSFRPVGGSMRPRIESGALVTVEPVGPGFRIVHRDLKPDDIVLCRVGVGGWEYVHLVKAIRDDDGQGLQFLIGNNRGKVNGWTDWASVFGKVVRVQP